MLGRLTQIAAGDADADFSSFTQLGKSTKRVRNIQGVVKVRNDDRGAKMDGDVRGDGGKHHQLAAVTNVVVDPDVVESLVGGESSQSNQFRQAVVIRQMGDELKSELTSENGHGGLSKSGSSGFGQSRRRGGRGEKRLEQTLCEFGVSVVNPLSQ